MPRERAQRVGDIPLQKGAFNACDHQYHPPFQVRMILIEFVHGCHTARKGCHTPPSRVKTLLETPETLNARVAFAGENKDFLRESIAPEAKSLQQPCLMGEQFSRLAAYKAVEPFQSYVRFV
jgi:hypothetical protein